MGPSRIGFAARALTALLSCAEAPTGPLAQDFVAPQYARGGQLKVQVCHKGQVKDMGIAALNAHVNHGDCQLPACDGANVFHVGNPCSTSGASNGKCALANPRAQSGSPACADGTVF